MSNVLYMPMIDVFYDFYWAQIFFIQDTTSQNHPNIMSTFEFDSRGFSKYPQLITPNIFFVSTGFGTFFELCSLGLRDIRVLLTLDFTLYNPTQVTFSRCVIIKLLTPTYCIIQIEGKFSF